MFHFLICGSAGLLEFNWFWVAWAGLDWAGLGRTERAGLWLRSPLHISFWSPTRGDGCSECVRLTVRAEMWESKPNRRTKCQACGGITCTQSHWPKQVRWPSPKSEGKACTSPTISPWQGCGGIFFWESEETGQTTQSDTQGLPNQGTVSRAGSQT